MSFFADLSRPRAHSQRGFTLVEVLAASVVLSICLVTAVSYQVSSMKAGTKLKDRAFATQKCIQMMEELRGYVNGGLETNIDVLDGYDDGAIFNSVLTTEKKVTNQADPLSGNTLWSGSWHYLRQVSVRRIPETPNARLVTVRVYYAKYGSSSQSSEKLAEVTSILKTIGNISVPTQVLDVYILALENVPGWWSNMATLRPMFDNSMSDLEGRNPGLEIRRHWITRLAYGRDSKYAPYVNLAQQANAGTIGKVFFYPGMLDASTNRKYYEPNNITGRFNLDGTLQHDLPETDPSSGYTTTPYSMADTWNHAMRYEDELKMYNSAVTLEPTLEPSLRLLLEDMNSNPTRYANALVVNLHGELLPLPPMHNYSDPAKDPRLVTSGGQPFVRAVTHPECLYYASGDSVVLRTYTYLSNPTAVGAPALTHAFVVLNGASGSVTIDSVLQLNVTDSVWVNYPLSVTTVNSDIVIDLPASRTSRPALGTGRGLNSTKRLYGMDYIPCAFRGAFVKDLRDKTNSAKNTAEWVIKLHQGGSGILTVDTRLGDPILTPWAAAPNVSRTWVYVGANKPPITESYQLFGDPRHMPYKDVQKKFGYNWYFTSVDTSQYQGITKTVAGWGGAGSLLDFDVPRYYGLWRTAMLNSTALWTNMTGFSFYYLGTGGEMGADASNGFASGLPINQDIYNASGSGYADEITNATANNSARIPARNDLSWYAKPWLGELYPDDVYETPTTGWKASGNLPTGTGNFYRAPYNFSGSPMTFSRQRRTNSIGCSSLFNSTGGGSGPYRHEYRDSDVATITSDGLTLSGRYNLGVPSTISASRPFVLNYGSGYPPEWSDTAYSNNRTTTSFMKAFYDAPYSSSYRSSASVKLTQGSKRAYFVMNGLSPQTSSGAAWMARFSLISMIQSFFDAGDPANGVTVAQIPRVKVLTPDPNDDLANVASINVTWSVGWNRWDTQSYSSPAYTPSQVSMLYVLKYSNDGGRTWLFADDNTAARPGERALDGSGNDLHTISQPFSWNVSALARGSYLLRLEAFRQNTKLHYAYHQVQIYLKRSGV